MRKAMCLLVLCGLLLLPVVSAVECALGEVACSSLESCAGGCKSKADLDGEGIFTSDELNLMTAQWLDGTVSVIDIIAALLVPVVVQDCYDATTNPIPLCTCDDLQKMNLNDRANYELQNDIDCSDTVNWGNGAGYSPTFGFYGVLDGQGHFIKDLYINRGNVLQYMGLFRILRVTGEIKNIGLENSEITGFYNVGGLAGQAELGSKIVNSYVEGKIKGDKFIGGLVGKSEGVIISTSYFSGEVSGAFSGGLVGYSIGPISTTDSYWDFQIGGVTSSKGGEGKTTVQMKNQSSYPASWDFADVWAISPDVNGGYPHLRAFAVS